MKKVLRVLFHPLLLAIVGTAAIAALVWWVGPLIAFGEKRPLDDTGTRIAIVIALFVLLALVVLFKAWRRRRANAALIDGIAAGPSAADKEAAALNEKFAQAVSVLRETQKGKRLFGGGQYLYELPWYAFVGAPGSGKTTALLNSGLTFPLAAKLGQSSFKGVGGTRNCDWWFTDQAVLIDTAGRYATQESDAQTDSAAWSNFLALLKKTRPRRPLNGILLTVNVQDLLQQPPAERKEHAARLRARIQELHDQLGVRPPVYVLVTKADLVAGFDETFGDLPKDERDQVWGFSFAYDPAGEKDPLTEFGTEFAALERRIRERLITRLEAERDIQRRAAIFAFPQQLAGLKGLLGGFLELVFSGGGGLEERPLLRGVYLTSGTQEGTPIDRVMGTLARAFGVERKVAAAGAKGARGKSFFLHKLLTGVVFTEQGLVGANRAHEARRSRMRLASLAAMLLLSAVLVGGWAVSYLRNKSYVDSVEAKLPPLKAAVEALPPSSSSDLSNLPVVLAQVRTAAQPQGFDVDAPPLLQSLGLYQGDKLDAAAELSYYRLLDHALMPRVARRIEEKLRAANKDNLELAYESLKAYLMLYTPERFDAETLKLFVTTDWEVNLARALTPEQREALTQHLDASLARGAPRPTTPIDDKLVAGVRQMLIAFPLEFRVVSRLKRQRLGASLPEFSVAGSAGPNATQVFERASGKPLTEGVPGLYTREGYKREFNNAVAAVTKQLANEEQWVLGTRPQGGTLKDLEASGELVTRARRLFLEDYVKVWDAYLADVRMVKLQGLERSVQVARLLSGVDSPLTAFLRGVARETTLTDAPAPKPQAEPGKTGIGAIDRRTETARQSMTAVLGGQAAAADTVALERKVDDHFAAQRRLVEGQPAPIDEVLKMFNEVYVQLSAVDAAQKSKSAPPPAAGMERIKAAAGQQPEPIRSMLAGLTDAGAAQGRAAERSSLTGELKPTTDFCNRAIAGRYPFAAGSTADVLPEDFGQMFGAGGMLDDFFQRKLIALVDTGTNPWSFKPTGDGSKPVGTAALADFQRAARIKEVFFRGGGKAPAFKVDIRALELAEPLKELTLDIDGQALKFVAGNTTSQSVSWPSAKVASEIKLITTPASTAALTFSGPWALFRLFDRFQVQPGAQPEKFVVAIDIEGKKARLEVTSNSVFNPFRLREVQQFRCPGAL